MDVLIRDLPDDVHAELVCRAAAGDISLRAYLRALLCEHVAVPSIEQWLEHVHGLEAVRSDSPTGAELVAAARAEDDRLLGR